MRGLVSPGAGNLSWEPGGRTWPTTPFAELDRPAHQTKIAAKMTFQSEAPRGLICFGSKYG